MFILGHTSRLDYRSGAVGFIDLRMLITISGTCTITVILAYAPYALNGSDGPDGIGFDKDPATVGVAASWQEVRLRIALRQSREEEYIRNGILYLVQALGTPARTPFSP